MKTPFYTLKMATLAASTVLLTACFDSDDNDGHAEEHEHEHALLISQTNQSGLALLEEGETESLTESALGNAAQLLLADNGELAAAVEGGAIEFIDGHHEELITIAGLDANVTKVINTNGHFSVLVNGATQLVPYATLETETPDSEAAGLSIADSEVYPALVLHEHDENGDGVVDEVLALGFDAANFAVYENGTTLGATYTKSCTGEISTAQYGEFVLVSCGADNYSVHVEGETVEITPLTAITAAVDWKVRAGVFVGLGNDEFYIREIDGESLVAEGPFDSTQENAELCAWGIDSEKADIFSLTATALTVYDHEGTATDTITLDAASTCGKLKMATASQAVFVIDNTSQTLYEIDKEATSYHIHGREDVSVNDVASVVSFHEIETEGGHEAHD